MNILQLSPQYPFTETDGGKKGIVMFFRGFTSLGHNVSFVYLGEKPSNHFYSAPENSEIFHINHSTKNTLFRKIQAVFSNNPLYIQKHNSDKIREELIKFSENRTFDIIHADHTAMAELAIFMGNHLKIPVVLRLHNVEWKIWERYANRCSRFSPLHYYIKRQAKLLKQRETELCELCDYCLTITDNDKEAVFTMSQHIRTEVIPFGVHNTQKNSKDTSDKEQYSMLLATTWAWRHNVDGAMWFINNVLPIIRNSIPDVNLYLLGKHLPDVFQSFKNEGVVPVGYVDDIEEYYKRCMIFISPLFVGSGIRVKILEAMSYGLPVIATEIGAEGINVGKSDGLFISDNASEQANIIIELLKKDDLVFSLGKNAHNHIEEKYDEDKLILKTLEIYKKIITKTM